MGFNTWYFITDATSYGKYFSFSTISAEISHCTAGIEERTRFLIGAGVSLLLKILYLL